MFSDHPFKRGVRALIGRHFAPEIANRFQLFFEWEKYNPDASLHVWRQKRDGRPIAEVHYELPSGLSVFICDLYPWDSRARTEARLLRYITDKLKSGQLGEDWEVDSAGRINKLVTGGTLATPDHLDHETTDGPRTRSKRAA